MTHISACNVSVSLPVFDVNGRSLRKKIVALGRRNALADANDGLVYVQALTDITFTLEEGDRLGLVGANGAGKSTLLRVLGGIYKPSSGRVEKRGKSVSLLNITLGLDDNSTGRENIRLRGLFLGMDPRHISEQEHAISEFSELGDYLDMPVRTYSSGMRMRLAFAISMAVHADILLLDEVLGVGDSAFQEKAKKRVRKLSESSGIVVLAMHSGTTIMEMCNKALWLDHGRVRMFGECHDVVRSYDDFMHGRSTL